MPLRSKPDNDNAVEAISPCLYRTVIARRLDWLTLGDVARLGVSRLTSLVMFPCNVQA